MGKKMCRITLRISQGPSLGGRATVHIMIACYIYAAVVNVYFMDAFACRQEIMDIFHFYADRCAFRGCGSRRYVLIGDIHM